RDNRIVHCSRSGDPEWLSAKTVFAEELLRLQNPDDGFLALFGNHRPLDLSLLKIEHRVRNIPLREHYLTLAILRDRYSAADLGDEGLWIKRVSGRIRQDKTSFGYFH